MENASAFFEPLGDGRFRATAATQSPWDARMQHGGPPSALAAALIERLHPRPEMRIARISLDFLGAIPLGEIGVRTRVVRPGRRVELLEAALECGGREVVLARAWRIATNPEIHRSLPEGHTAPHPPVPPLESATERRFMPAHDFGYADALEWRFISEARESDEAAQVWMRPRVPLIAGERLGGLERLLICADSANGVSSRLSFNEWLFVPPTLTVTLHRYPSDEWIFMRAITTISDDGLGFAESMLADQHGFVGAGAHPLLIESRAT
ncbi:MAG: thioesterase family protein [Vulcanimicrobiaceae bacterium]